MEYPPYDKGEPFYAYYKKFKRIEVILMKKIAFTGGEQLDTYQ